MRDGQQSWQVEATPAIQSPVRMHGNSKRKAVDKPTAEAVTLELFHTEDFETEPRRSSWSPSPAEHKDKVKFTSHFFCAHLF